MDEIEALYRQYATAILRFAWGLSGSRSEAEDLVSETFVKLLTGHAKIETRTALAYLLAITRNAYLTRRRRRSREVALPDEIGAYDDDLTGRLDNRARLGDVVRALAALPEGERSALLLRVDHELPYDEIAAALGITVGAARVRVHRARLRLAHDHYQRGG
jgi:RNA polymerase sigma-70 factor (ECF subfamily)